MKPSDVEAQEVVLLVVQPVAPQRRWLRALTACLVVLALLNVASSLAFDAPAALHGVSVAQCATAGSPSAAGAYTEASACPRDCGDRCSNGCVQGGGRAGRAPGRAG